MSTYLITEYVTNSNNLKTGARVGYSTHPLCSHWVGVTGCDEPVTYCDECDKLSVGL